MEYVFMNLPLENQSLDTVSRYIAASQVGIWILTSQVRMQSLNRSATLAGGQVARYLVPAIEDQRRALGSAKNITAVAFTIWMLCNAQSDISWLKSNRRPAAGIPQAQGFVD